MIFPSLVIPSPIGTSSAGIAARGVWTAASTWSCNIGSLGNFRDEFSHAHFDVEFYDLETDRVSVVILGQAKILKKVIVSMTWSQTCLKDQGRSDAKFSCLTMESTLI